ncbi:hypothetical protein ACP70R_000207 [Stipagrostis hirtigluma subsp. patula]
MAPPSASPSLGGGTMCSIPASKTWTPAINVDEGLHHGDEEEPLGVSDLLLDGLVGGSRGAGDLRVELAEHTLSVLPGPLDDGLQPLLQRVLVEPSAAAAGDNIYCCNSGGGVAAADEVPPPRGPREEREVEGLRAVGFVARDRTTESATACSTAERATAEDLNPTEEQGFGR